MKFKSINSPKIRLGVFIFLLVFFLGGGIVWWQKGLAAPNPQDTKPQIFVVQQGDGVREIATRLKSQGLIKDQIVFFLLIKKLGIDQDLQAGDFRLSPSMNAEAVAQSLTKGMLDSWITLLEGWRKEEIAVKLAAELSIPENQFLKYATEGYMFPDTYLIPKNATAAAIVNILKDNFNSKYNADLKKDATKSGLSEEQIVTLASIVEKEAAGDKDRNIIAGILLKRLKKGWPLQTDATIQYALGYQPDEHTWWKKELTDADKKVNSPYNSYTNLGLPPGPICNPGLASIKAVIYPESSDYWYYLHSPDGTVHYAATLEDHEANIVKYL